MKKYIFTITLTLTALFFTACNKEDETSKTTSENIYKAGDIFTIKKGETIENTSGDAKVKFSLEDSSQVTVIVGTVTVK